ncbi:hypothetical protein [Runella zeae]|uniref:hypothetical protein n=1 Tax=Runella zeae TaxID=94255 RepID=UPI002354B50B|nr:hypothetical protein [Runella zeae]
MVAYTKELVALRDELVNAWRQQRYDMMHTQDDRPIYEGAESSYTMSEVRRRLGHSPSSSDEETERRLGGAFSNEIVKPIIENWHE